MKGFIIQAEWCEKILLGKRSAYKKTWEIRGMGCNQLDEDIALIESSSGGRGQIIGTFKVRAVHGPFTLRQLMQRDRIKKHQVSPHALREWGGYRKGNYCWEIYDVVRFNKPVDYDHPHGAVIWVGEDSIPQRKVLNQKKLGVAV